MSKILTITLNPAIDVRYNLDTLNLGNVNRPHSIEKSAGGKGINVSRIINFLGGNVLATGIVGGFTGKLFLKKLNDNGISNDFLETEYETRTCIAMISKDVKGVTEVLESGKGDDLVCKEFVDKYLSILNSQKIDVICASGSILKNIDPLIYNTLIEEANKKGIRFILDTSGSSLTNGIKAQPFLIKPNKEELEGILNRKLQSDEDVVAAARELIKQGVKNVMVTLGGDGALFVTEERVMKATFPKVEIKNTVGSGDSTIGGFAFGLAENKEITECFRLGVACGTTNAMLDSTGTIEIPLLNTILPTITITQL